jgi:DNA-binding transcriptional regulator YiaG
MDGLDQMSDVTEPYHYTMCGLDYVYLRDGYTLRETRHGNGIAIHDALALHEAIARVVITRPKRLRGQEVRFLRSLLKLSQDGLARVLGTKRASVARWEARLNHAVPGAADAALRLFYALKADKHGLAEQICDILAEIDNLEHEIAVLKHRITLRETAHGWEREAA